MLDIVVLMHVFIACICSVLFIYMSVGVDLNLTTIAKGFPKRRLVMIAKGAEGNPPGSGWLQHLGRTDNSARMLLFILCKLP